MTSISAPPGPSGSPGTAVPPDPPSRRPVIPAAASAAPAPAADGALNPWSPSNTPGWYRVVQRPRPWRCWWRSHRWPPQRRSSFERRRPRSRPTRRHRWWPSKICSPVSRKPTRRRRRCSSPGRRARRTGGRRNLYLDALERSARQTEEVAAGVGDDPVSHAALQDIVAALTTYSGEIEASRLANQLSQPGADTSLVRALDLAQDDDRPPPQPRSPSRARISSPASRARGSSSGSWLASSGCSPSSNCCACR